MGVIEKTDPVELGRRLKAARNAARLTQDQAAERIGAVRTTVVAIERGSRRLTETELMALCELYGISPGRLLRADSVLVDLTPQFRLS